MVGEGEGKCGKFIFRAESNSKKFTLSFMYIELHFLGLCHLPSASIFILLLKKSFLFALC